MYKMVAVDLDGTLLNDEKWISEENLEFMGELADKGYEIVIATGRRYWSAKRLTKKIDRPLVILANNGNVVRETTTDKTIITKYLDLDDFKLLIREGKKKDLHPIVHVDNYDEGYDIIIEMNKDHENYHNYLRWAEKRYREVNSYLELEDGNVLVVVYAGAKEDMEHFHLELTKKYPQKYSSHVMENIQMSEALLEVMNPMGCKWLSLLEYAKMKGIDRSEIIAIGDDNNDIQMIQNVGCGIAMKNATEGAKQVADIITEKDNNESGVAFELKKVLGM
ncbi:MAG TPA: Cof-type HAD-IIB family hydrolase [Tepidimicrobium sp.]|nr:Cof-type HAD-IIB family hydrolase [Tepidimicrobium sp.]